MPWDGATWVPHEIIRGNATTYTELLQYANEISGDAFGLAMLSAIFLIIFIAGQHRSDNSGASLSAGILITTILSYIMASMDVVGNWVAWTFTFILVGSVVLLYKGGSNNV